MTIVIDASVMVASLVNRDSAGAWARALLPDEILAAPELVLAEASNVLRRLELGGQLNQTLAAATAHELTRFPVELFPYRPLAGRVWELRLNLSSYDAWYLALAEALECPLATLDRRLVGSSGPRCRFLTPDRN